MAFTESSSITPIEPRDPSEISGIHEPFPAVTPSAPYVLINEKFDRTMEVADEMLVKLQGADGNSGYLGTLNSLITEYALPALPDLDVDINLETAGTLISPPSTDMSGIVTDFGIFDGVKPAPVAIPTIDTSDLGLITAPDSSLDTTIDWSEISLNSDLYATLISRLQNDLVVGATGLDATVEAEIYARARARNIVEDDNRVDQIDAMYSGSRWDMPSGSFVAAHAEAADESGRRLEEINGKIMIDQADLAQKNSHFIIGQAVALEKLFRDTRDSESNRMLDKAKADVANELQRYAEMVKAYVAEMEANKIYIEAQLGALQGAVEYNKGIFDVYSTEAAVYETLVGAKSKVNDAIVSVYEADIKGYTAEQNAIIENQKVIVENNKAVIAKAEVELRSIIAKIDTSIEGYKTELLLKERVSNDMAQIASQTVASTYSSTNVSASMGYSGGESRSESFNHGESVSQTVSFSQSVSEDHNYSHNSE